MTDELRAKFEAHFSQPPYSWRFRLNKVEDICGWPGAYDNYYVECAWKGWDAAHASRDAEVEALRKDAERYRWLVKNAEIIECHHWHWWNHDSDVTPIAERIDAAMREESK